MTNQNLRDLLEQLHNELTHTNTVDEKGRELLRDLGVDIQKLLDSPVDIGPQENETFLHRIKDAIDHLEVDHPTLTMALSELMSILSNAGI